MKGYGANNECGADQHFGGSCFVEQEKYLNSRFDEKCHVYAYNQAL
jgi:hypothetical protein